MSCSSVSSPKIRIKLNFSPFFLKEEKGLHYCCISETQIAQDPADPVCEVAEPQVSVAVDRPPDTSVVCGAEGLHASASLVAATAFFV